MVWWPASTAVDTKTDWAALVASAQLATVGDMWDDGDKNFNVSVAGSVVYDCADAANPTVATCTTLVTGLNLPCLVTGVELALCYGESFNLT